jgi:hypothetical protein
VVSIRAQARPQVVFSKDSEDVSIDGGAVWSPQFRQAEPDLLSLRALRFNQNCDVFS